MAGRVVEENALSMRDARRRQKHPVDEDEGAARHGFHGARVAFPPPRIAGHDELGARERTFVGRVRLVAPLAAREANVCSVP
eukprot:3915678-Prymnesium_polylepis.1